MDAGRPDIVIYPPLASVVAPLTAIALEWALPLDLLPGLGGAIWMHLAGAVLILAAGALAVAGERAFRRAGTHVDPRAPALILVEAGPYRFTRNPMYLGMVMLQAGLALSFSLDWALVFAPVLWAVLHWGVVLREERYLKARFGAAYEAFMLRTRRWI